MKSIFAGAALFLCAGAALAQVSDQGLYVAARAGAVFADADEIPDFFEVDTGFAVLGSAGYAFGSGLRLEGEAGWRRIEAGPVIQLDENIYNFFINALYELPLGPIRPYAGAGIGLAVVDLEVDFGFDLISDEEASFAYQLIGGLAFPLAGNIDLVADYRYTATEGLEFAEFEADEEAHTVTGGVRLSF